MSHDPAACHMLAGPFPKGDRRCDLCADPLPKGRRRWCSDVCSEVYVENHGWVYARQAAIRRDGWACRRCGTGPYALGEAEAAVDALLRALSGHRPREAWYAWQRSPERRRLALDVSLEVNHRTPILGRHAEWSCIHHLDGLETCCHRCHVAITAEQFGHRTTGERTARALRTESLFQ